MTDADAEQNVRRTYTTTYDEAGRVASAGDGVNDLQYTYSIFGLLSSTTQDLDGLSDQAVFTYSHDVLGRVTRITQAGVSGGNDVAEKRVDLAYSDDGTRWTLTRLADLAGTKFVAETDHVFDQLGRIGAITHGRAGTQFADYDFTWDAAGNWQARWTWPTAPAPSLP